MAMSYRRVSVLLSEPPHNQNSAFILEKNHVKKNYVKNLEIKKKKKTCNASQRNVTQAMWL